MRGLEPGWPLLWLGVGLLLAPVFQWGFRLYWSRVLGVRLDPVFLNASALALLLSVLGPWIEEVRLPYTYHPVQRVELMQAATAFAVLFLWFAHALHRLSRSEPTARMDARFVAKLTLPFILFYAVIGGWTYDALLTGDAPHYLLITNSLLVDGDFDLANDYAEDSHLPFYAGKLASQVPLVDDKIYSHHLTGLSILIAVPYWLGGLLGARLVLDLIAGLTVALMLMLLRDAFSWREAVIGTGLFAFSISWVIHSNAFYAETLSTFLLVVFMLAVRDRLAPVAGYAAVGCLLWINLRFYLPGLLAAIWFFFSARDSRHRLGIATLGLLLFGALLKNFLEMGSWSPFAPFAFNGIRAQNLFVLDPMVWLTGFFGMFFDQEYGWYWYQPALLLGTSGLIAAALTDWRASCVPALCVVLYLVPTFPRLDWHGVMAPARYLLFLLPLFVLGAIAYRRQSRLRWPFVCLALLQVSWGWLGAVLPQLAWPMLDGRNVMLAALDDRLAGGLSSVTPSFLTPRTASWVWATLGSAVILKITTSQVLRGRAGGRSLGQCGPAPLVARSARKDALHDSNGP